LKEYAVSFSAAAITDLDQLYIYIDEQGELQNCRWVFGED
jgi:hypothetical protein